MLIPLPKYVQIKDNYCIGYAGNDIKQIHNIIKARPLIEQTLPGIKIYLALKDQFVKNLENVIPWSQLKKADHISYFREIEDIKDLLEESKIEFAENFFE